MVDWYIKLAAILSCLSFRVVESRTHHEKHHFYGCKVIGRVEREEIRSKRFTEFFGPVFE